MTVRKPINIEEPNPNRFGTERDWTIAAIMSAAGLLLPVITLARLIAEVL